MTELSVIVPAYNAVTTLQACVRSILGQSVPPQEIIIADDCSTDGTQNLIKDLANRHGTIRPILRQKNIGVAANRDLAIRDAKGTLITQLDADDTIASGKFSAEIEILKGKANSVAISDYEVINPAQNSEIVYSSVSQYSNCLGSDLLRKLTVREYPIPRDMMFSKSLYLDAGGYSHEYRLYEDWEFKLRLAGRSGQWLATNVAGTRYCRLSTGLSQAALGRHAYWRTRALLDNREWLIPALSSEVFGACLFDALELEEFLHPAAGPVTGDTIKALVALCEQHPDALGLQGPRKRLGASQTLVRLGQSAFGEELEDIFVTHGLARRHSRMSQIYKWTRSRIGHVADKAVFRPIRVVKRLTVDRGRQ